MFSTGAAIGAVGRAYAGAIMASDVKFDMLFGPAYKGIPLATVTAAHSRNRGRNLPYAFNRKEAKDTAKGATSSAVP